MFAYKKITLANGIRVVLVPHRDTAAVTLLALYEVGSRYETARVSGVSHFIEHMMFKGTRRRPATLDISKDLDSVGADYNAFTGKDHTGYYIKLPADRLTLAVDMLHDMIYRSRFRQKDIDSERSVINEEIRMYEDNPMMLVDDVLEEALFEGSTLGWRISGSPESMAGISRKDLVGFHARHYGPSRTVVALAGRFDEDKAVALLERTFGSRPRVAEPKHFTPLRTGKAAGRAPRVRIVKRETEQVQLALGWPSFGYGHPRLAAAKLMSIVLGGTMSSRLFLSVRERHGLAYSIRASVGPYQDVGALTVQAGLAKDRLPQALELILEELARIKRQPVAAAELKRAKDYVRGKLVLNLEDSSQLADWYARQELLRRKIETPEARIRKFDAVTAADIRAVARETFRAGRGSLALIGPFEDPAPFAKAMAAL